MMNDEDNYNTNNNNNNNVSLLSRPIKVWDLSDSLAELYENEQRMESVARTHLGGERGNSRQEAGADRDNVQPWLGADPGNGYIRIYAPSLKNFNNSQLIACTQNTSVHKVCVD